jgi:hypothetical protein
MTAQPGHEIGGFFWLSWLRVIAAFNAWMALVVHPNTDAYNGLRRQASRASPRRRLP